MKKLTVWVALFLTTTTFAQSVFDKFEDNNEVTTVVVTKQAFLMLKKVTAESKEAQEYKNLVNGLDELKVFTTENIKTAGEMRSTFEQHISSKKLTELIRVKDKEAHVKIYTRPGKTDDFVSEFVMLVDQIGVSAATKKPELVIVTLTGNINLNDIAKITSEMNIPGNQHVKTKK